MGDVGFWLLMAVPFAVGAAIVTLSIRYIERSLTRTFMLIMGVSLAAFPVFIVLHNAVYGAFIRFLGEGFWQGGDEPVFLVVAFFVCPLGFLTGVVGSLVMAVRRVLYNKS